MNLHVCCDELGPLRICSSRIRCIDITRRQVHFDGVEGHLTFSDLEELNRLITAMPNGLVLPGGLMLDAAALVAVDERLQQVYLQGVGPVTLPHPLTLSALAGRLLQERAEQTAQLEAAGRTITLRLDQIGTLAANGRLAFKHHAGHLELGSPLAAQVFRLPYWEKPSETWTQLAGETVDFPRPVLPVLSPRNPDELEIHDTDSGPVTVASVTLGEAEFRLNRFREICEELRIHDVELKREASDHVLLRGGVIAGRISLNVEARELRMSFLGSLAQKDTSAWRGDDYYMTLGFLQFGQVLDHEDIRIIKQDAQAALQRQGPRQSQEAWSWLVPGRQSSPRHQEALRLIHSLGRARKAVGPLNFMFIKQLFEELGQLRPADRSHLLTAAAGSLRFNLIRGTPEIMPWVRNEAHRIQHPELGQKYRLEQREAAAELLIKDRAARNLRRQTHASP